MPPLVSPRLPTSVSVVATSTCAKLSTAHTEIWHALPSGTYSSLTNPTHQCRGTYDGGSFHVSTLMPGSYGLFSGLGPSQVDFPPYGPKIVHFRVTAPGFKTLTTQVEVGAWSGDRDMRGPQLVTGGGGEGFQVTSETDGKVQGSLKLVLEPDGKGGEEEEDMCSFMSFLNPMTFFTEPLAVCSGSLIFKFFDL